MASWADGAGEGSAAVSSSAADDGSPVDDDDEYEEAEGGNSLLGFMFGNVDNSGDLDVDYLDEDAKEHLAALADKLGPSLTDIDLSAKSPQTPSDATDQDYDQKAENAVDYEDINEAYEGPEVHATEEDFLLPKKDFFSKEVSVSSLGNKTSVFDDDNYDDEDEDLENQKTAGEPSSETQCFPPSDEQNENHCHEILSQEESLQDKVHALKMEDSDAIDSEEDDSDASGESTGGAISSVLPVLYVEDGKEILRFSEIFGVQEPLRKGRKRDCRYLMAREKYMSMDASEIVEEDEEEFMKARCQDCSWMKQFQKKTDVLTGGIESDSKKPGIVLESGKLSLEADDSRKDTCISSEPMKDDLWVSKFNECNPLFSPKFYPIDQEDWEDRIVWDNSPSSSTENVVESIELSGPDSDTPGDKERDLKAETHSTEPEIQSGSCGKHDTPFLNSCSILVEPFATNEEFQSANVTISGGRSHPQILRLESQLEKYTADSRGVKDDASETKLRTDAIQRFSELTMQNRDIVEGSWLDNIVWEPGQPVDKPKLIYDLQDQQMLFEISDMEDAKYMQLHAGAMIVARSLDPSGADSVELHNHGMVSAGRFNISNDKFYSNRKSSQQLRPHSKKRTGHGLKVLHSVPALKLQTMKAKLSNKDVSNFHRPKALWYPHDIEVPFKEHGKLALHGPIKIIMKSLGGKGSKLHVDAEETIASVKAKASKKFDFRLSEPVKIFYSGRELEDSKSVAEQNVQANSVLHLIRTKIHLLPRAQKLPSGNKSLRPPGAFKKKSDLSVKDGHVFLMEYCEERPLLLGNPGMGARLCTYYQKIAPGDQTGNLLRNGNSGLGSVVVLDPADKSPFLGDIKPGSNQSCLETNMYRAPIFQQKVASTDYLLVRSSKGKLSIRRIDRIDVVGQQEPHIEVMTPGSKGVQLYIMNRLLVYMYREFRAAEKRGVRPSIRTDELFSLFPSLSEAFLRKRLKNCAELQRGPNGHFLWVMRRNFRIPSEEELRRMVTPENVCAYESMLAGMYRLKRLGITRLTTPSGLAPAMNQLPDEAIALAAASHIERELQITPWNLSSNFVSCTNQNRENIERLEITGVGDPTGRGLGFSYVRATPKAPISNAVVKKKAVVGKGTTVTGTDADLRRLSMEAAKELLLKFNVSEEQIEKLTRWHRIALIRKLSSEQAASGVKVDPTTVSKFARGQRMSFLQLQQQTREKCQEIWDRQVQSLCAGDGEENESESEANSDLDSFAGDLENLLDAEECEEGAEDNYEAKRDGVDGVRGLKMRRRQFQTRAEEEIEDEAAEAAELCRMLMDDDEAEKKKKKKSKAVQQVDHVFKPKFGPENTDIMKKSNAVVKRTMQPEEGPLLVFTEQVTNDQKEVQGESFFARKPLLGKFKAKKKTEIDQMGLLNKKVKIVADGMNVIKEKKSARDTFVCGACGQLGHMRTNKNCPRYREDPEARSESTDLDRLLSGRPNFLDQADQGQPRPLAKKIMPKFTNIEPPEDEIRPTSKAKFLKVKCGATDKLPDKHTPTTSQTTDRPITSDPEKSAMKINKIIFSNKTKLEDPPPGDTPKPAVIIRPPAEAEREPPRKKIIIKQPKEIINLDENSQDGSFGFEYKKTKKMIELSGLDRRLENEGKQYFEESSRVRENHQWAEGRRNFEVRVEDRNRRVEKMRLIDEQPAYDLLRYEESIRREREEEQRAKAKKKKKRKPEIKDDYLDDFPIRRNDRRMHERERVIRRRTEVEYAKHAPDYGLASKRRRGGEVGLSNLLESIVETLRERTEISYLFLKPVTRKEAPDYLDIISRPMDLSTIRDKVRRMEYKNRDDFRHDVCQIVFNAHKYNDRKNPGIPPLADQLLELCDFLLEQYDDALAEAEAGIE